MPLSVLTPTHTLTSESAGRAYKAVIINRAAEQESRSGGQELGPEPWQESSVFSLRVLAQLRQEKQARAMGPEDRTTTSLYKSSLEPP